MSITTTLADIKRADIAIKKRHRYACGIESDEVADQLKSGGARLFFTSPDGQNGELYRELRELGWRHSHYAAEYHWKLKKEGDEIHYTEGDIYIITK